MKIDATLVKKLREMTGAGMLEVKKALIATKGHVENAVDYLKERGLANAAKKIGRIAADGIVGITSNGNKAIIMELNCETDFVALTDDFQNLFKTIINTILDNNVNNIKEANDLVVDGETINTIITTATSKIGEKISLRRFEIITKTNDQAFGLYTHSNKKIASITIINGKDATIAKNVAMHITAMNPKYMTSNDIPIDKLKEYKEEILHEMSDINKPDNIKDKIAEGKLRKVLSQMVLLDQEFVMESKKLVAQYLKENNSSFVSAYRFEVGEGIEKKSIDFASEVKSQMK